MDHGRGSACPFRRQNSKTMFSTMAEAHRSRSPSGSPSLFLPSFHNRSNEQLAPISRLNDRLALPPTSRPHFPGDGMDYRSPVNYSRITPSDTTHLSPTIDLTDEDDPANGRSDHAANSSRAHRLPRFDRDIIGISDDDDDDDDGDDEDDLEVMEVSDDNGIGLQQPTSARATAPIEISSSPDRRHGNTTTAVINLLNTPSVPDEVEFIEIRPRSRPPISPRHHLPDAYDQRDQALIDAIEPIDLTADNDLTTDLTEDDDVVLLDQRQRSRPVDNDNRERLEDMLSNHGGTHYLRRLVIGHGQQSRQNQMELPQIPRRSNEAGTYMVRGMGPLMTSAQMQFHQTLNHGMPGGLDVEQTGFDWNSGETRPSSKYVPPSPVKDGFTRSPEEDEIVVCPNCGDELAMGKSESKQQIYVIKGCGHAYCGDCAQHRLKAGNSKKGKGRATDHPGPAPFKTCVVNGCNTSASAKSMIHVYLGS